MSRYFSEELVEQIKQANDIVSVISEYVPLKKSGQNYWGCCPFHNEKTPSFSVTPEKGFFYCFGCKKAGNVVNFLMEYDHITYPESLERLANRAHIALPEEDMSPSERRRIAAKEALYEVNAMAATFFHNCLMKTNMGKVGLDYLLGRGLSMETITTFKLGFAPNSWDKLYEAFTDRGINENTLIKLGLCRRNESGRVYDYFRNRVMFPIYDANDRVLGFGGRVLDDGTPKYLNSPENEIFDKGRILFAFDQAHRSIRRERQAILMEGYMDVISAHNQGITNAVATLGTAYTKRHGQALMNQADEIVLSYDMDGAGRMAATRAIGLLQNTGFRVKVLSMPDGKDPDDYVRAHGAEAFLKLVEGAQDDFNFLANKALVEHPISTPEGQEAVLQELLPFILNESNPIRRESYEKWLQSHIGLKEEHLRQYINQFRKRGKIDVPSEGPRHMPKRLTHEEELLYVALSDQAIYERVMEYVDPEDYNNPLCRRLLEEAKPYVGESLSALMEVLDEENRTEERALLGRIMNTGVLVAPDARRVDGLIQSVTLQGLNKEYEAIKQQIRAAQTSGDQQRILALMQEATEVQREIKTLEEELKGRA